MAVNKLSLAPLVAATILSHLMILIYLMSPVLDDVKTRLRDAFVIIDPAERKNAISMVHKRWLIVNHARLMRPNLRLFGDIAGLVEWPTLLMGQIEDRFMALPPELLQSTIATHQKYITLSGLDGSFSKYFILVSNRLPDTVRDKVIVAGNQRVLRARLTDAEFFGGKIRHET